MLRTKFYLLTDGHGHLVEEKVRRFITVLKFVVPVILLTSLVGLYKFNEWNRHWNVHFRNPIQNPVVIEPVPQSQFQVNLAPRSEILTISERLFPTAKAAAPEEPQFPNIGDCEQYRPMVEKYFGKGKVADEALFVASKESGCIADRISAPNSDGTRDYCLFQINKEKLTTQSLETCVRRAHDKYVGGRLGGHNWSAFYAVCGRNVSVKGVEGSPIPKYPKQISNCN